MATQYTAGLSAGQVLTAATMNTIGATWETYTPTVTAQTGTITSFTARNGRYTRINKLVIVQYDIQILNNGTGAVWINITKPITGVSPLGGGTGAVGFGTETSISGVSHTVREGGTTNVLLLNITGAGYPGGNNARITGFFIYEAA
jgi:hypothetical protein